MWFRNLLLYRLSEKFDHSPEQLHAALQGRSFKPCAGLDAASTGWEPPLGPDAELLVHAAAGCLMVCARREERLLPAAVIREELDERVRQIEDAEVRTVRRNERQQIKDEIVVDLLPRAFTRSTRLYAYIDVANDWVVLDTPTVKRADEMLSLLRESMGSFPVKPILVERSPAAVMTDWLRRGAPPDFDLQDECELREPLENGGIVRCRRQALDGTEVGTHLDAGKLAVRLAVEWHERLSCLLCDDLVIRRLRFLDIVQDEAAAVDTEDAAARFDADFALMSMELRQFLPRLAEIFGGLSHD